MIRCRLFGRRPLAFTLIELLIVVAIIAILAAIAVPNFLEAQKRAKVARVKAEMRTIATGLESYAVDHNVYPPPDNVFGGLLAIPGAPSPGLPTFFETKITVRITTPVAYLSSLPDEPYPNLAEPSETYRPYHYSPRWYAALSAGGAETVEFDAFHFAMFGRVNSEAHYYFLSHGPDSDHDAGPSGGGTPGLPGHITGHGVAAYDPTNGTVSNGDLTYWGPGIGFSTSKP